MSWQLKYAVIQYRILQLLTVTVTVTVTYKKFKGLSKLYKSTLP